MKKITYISLLFFITSIFCLFMGFFGLKNTFADEIKIGGPYTNTYTAKCSSYDNCFYNIGSNFVNYKNSATLFGNTNSLGTAIYDYDSGLFIFSVYNPFSPLYVYNYRIYSRINNVIVNFPQYTYVDDYRYKKDGNMVYIGTSRFGSLISCNSYNIESGLLTNYNLSNTHPCTGFNDDFFIISNVSRVIISDGNMYKPSGKKILKYNLISKNWDDFFTSFDYNIADYNIIQGTSGLYLTVTTSENTAPYYTSNVFTYSLNQDGTIKKFIGYDFYALFKNQDGTVKFFNFTDQNLNVHRYNNYSFPLISFGISSMEGYQVSYIKPDGNLYIQNFNGLVGSGLEDQGGGNNSGGNEDIGGNCYIKDSYQFTTLNDISLHTENINDYIIDVGNNYLTYIKNSNQDEFGLIYDNFASISYKDSNNNELTGSGIDVLFNTGSYIDLKTALFGETSFFVYHDKPFNEITIQCKNIDTAKSRFTIYTGQSEKTSILEGNSYTSNEGDFACGDVIKFDESTSMIKIVVKGFRYNLQIQNIVIKENEISTVNNEICFDSTTGTYTKDGEIYEPTDQDKKEISKNINTDMSNGNQIFLKIFGKFTGFLNEIFGLFIITLPSTPDMNVVVPVPFITPDFKIGILYKSAVLSVIEDNLGVSQINTDDNSGRYFLVFFLSILYILIRVSIIGFTLFLFWMYWYIVKLFLSYVIGFSIQESIIGHPSNGIGLVVYVLVYGVVLTFFIGVFHYSIGLNDFLLSVTSWLNLFFTFISANIGMYNTLANIVNFFFAGVVVSLVGFLTLKHVIGFGRLN